MVDRQITKQYLQFIQQAGFKYSKDTLGFYFDNGMKKFSIMKSGPVFMCYYNVKANGSWVLKQKSQTMLQFEMCLRWILDCIQKGI